MPQLGTLTLPTATSSSEGIEGISRKVLEPRPPVPVDQIRVQRERENSETGPELVDFFRHKHYYKVNRDFDGVFMEL